MHIPTVSTVIISRTHIYYLPLKGQRIDKRVSRHTDEFGQTHMPHAVKPQQAEHV